MPSITVHYPTISANNTSYDSDTDIIHIKYEYHTKALDVVQHEYAHAVMDEVYNDDYPHTPGGTHYINKESDNITAWTEGWADFFPLSVQSSADNPPSPWVWEYGSGGQEDLEEPTWGDPADWEDGDKVEGRVAGALWDIFDYAWDGYDLYYGGFSDIWDIFTSQTTEDSFLEFWLAWLDDWKSANAWGALMQNTIAYTTMTATLQGPQRPNGDHPYDGHNVPLTVKFYDKDDVLTFENIMTEVPLHDFFKDDEPQLLDEIVIYDINDVNHVISFAVKWDDESIYTHENHIYNVTLVTPHTLINLMEDTDVRTLRTPLDMSTLLEGNANDDRQVELLDFGILRASFMATPDDPNWHEGAADFDRSLQVDMLDFGLLQVNFMKYSPQIVGGGGLRGTSTPVPTKTVDITLTGSQKTVKVGKEFEVLIRIDAGSQQLAGVSAFINFDPSYLEVVSVTPGKTLDIGLQNSYDNAKGTLSLSRGSFSEVDGSFTMATIVFKAKAATIRTDITFEKRPPRKTEVAFAGESVLDTATGLEIELRP